LRSLPTILGVKIDTLSNHFTRLPLMMSSSESSMIGESKALKSFLYGPYQVLIRLGDEFDFLGEMSGFIRSRIFLGVSIAWIGTRLLYILT
jgi:hypothetical protein